jgi:hypothetical protein
MIIPVCTGLLFVLCALYVRESGELQPRFTRSEVPARNSSRPVLMEKANSAKLRLRRK